MSSLSGDTAVYVCGHLHLILLMSATVGPHHGDVDDDIGEDHVDDDADDVGDNQHDGHLHLLLLVSATVGSHHQRLLNRLV